MSKGKNPFFAALISASRLISPPSTTGSVCVGLFGAEHRTQKGEVLYITESIIRYQNFSRYFFRSTIFLRPSRRQASK